MMAFATNSFYGEAQLFIIVTASKPGSLYFVIEQVEKYDSKYPHRKKLKRFMMGLGRKEAWANRRADAHIRK